jgi:hypothetical protein
MQNKNNPILEPNLHCEAYRQVRTEIKCMGKSEERTGYVGRNARARVRDMTCNGAVDPVHKEKANAP